ncbi:hypothetical protein ACWG8W_06165 [Citricoccus zhacaiensis]
MSFEPRPSTFVGWFIYDLRTVLLGFSVTLSFLLTFTLLITPLWAIPLALSVFGMGATGGVVAVGAVLAWVALMAALILAVGTMGEDDD